MNYPIWKSNQPNPSCSKKFPEEICSAPKAPDDFEAYNKEKNCFCACSQKTFKTNIIIIYKLLKVLSLQVSNLGDILSFAHDMDYYSITYVDHFSDPKMTEDNTTLLNYGGRYTFHLFY